MALHLFVEQVVSVPCLRSKVAGRILPVRAYFSDRLVVDVGRSHMPRAMLRVLCLCCFAASFRLPGAPARRSAPARPAASSATDDAEIIRSRIRSLRLNIVRQRREVDALEKVLECSSVDGLREGGVDAGAVAWANEQPWRDSARAPAAHDRRRDPAGFLVNQTSTGLRISKELVFNGQFVRDVLPNAPLLFSHASGSTRRSSSSSRTCRASWRC